MMPCHSVKKSHISPCSVRNGYSKCISKQTEKEMLLDRNTSTESTEKDRIISEALALSQNGKTGNLALMANFVKKYQDSMINLPNTKVTNELHIRLCGLDGTIYSGATFELEGWGALYLPEPTRMEVLGVLESSKGMVPFPQWIVLVGENGHVYGYGDEELYFLAISLKELLQDGIKDTSVSYTYAHEISDEDEEVLQKDEEIQKIRQKTRECIDKEADSFNEFLSLF